MKIYFVFIFGLQININIYTVKPRYLDKPFYQ